MKKRDVADFFIGQRALDEEINWIMTGTYKPILAMLLPRIKKYQVKSVVEWGCRSGIVANGLPETIDYLGFENNLEWLDMAKNRNPGRTIVPFAEMGEHLPLAAYDLAMCFNYMKHTCLEEWNQTLARILDSMKYGCFNCQLLEHDLDNGRDYPHVYVTPANLEVAIERAGHELVDRETLWEGHLHGHGPMRDIAVWTKVKS